jgi:hypothetical protein
MAIKVNGTTVIDDSRNLVNIASGAGSSTTFGDVGTYTRAGLKQTGTRITYSGGTTFSASSLFKPNTTNAYNLTEINVALGFVSPGLSGTWRIMHEIRIEDSANRLTFGLFVRIS